MSIDIDKKVEEISQTLQAELGEIELNVLARPFTLADAIREGAGVTTQAYNWTNTDGGACALSAAVLSARAHGYIAK